MRSATDLYNILSPSGSLTINFYDVGAAGGFIKKWEYPFIHFYGFEPDENEFTKIKQSLGPGKNAMNAALFSNHRRITINMCRKQQVSSLYEPNRRYLNAFPDAKRFDIIGQYECDAITLHSASKAFQAEINFIKLDTQGSELDILRGALDQLDEILVIEIETEFHEMYLKQPVFSDVHAFMIENGFRLLNIVGNEWVRDVDLVLPGRKELMFCDAVYFKELDLNLDHAKLLAAVQKQILISYIYGFYNLSYFLLRSNIGLFSKEQSDSLLEFFQEIERMEFRRANGWRATLSKMIRGMVHQLGRLIPL